MLLGNLFHILTDQADAEDLAYRIELDPAHAIFQGHFPGRPVLPGVCQVQILEELLSLSASRPLRLKSSVQMKFLSLVDPLINKQLDIRIKMGKEENGVVLAEATYAWEAMTFFKIKGKFSEYGGA